MTSDGQPTINKGALATVWLTLFLDLVAFGIIIPVLPYYAQHFGASASVVTLLSTTFSLAQFAFAPVLGRLSDRYGRRPVMLISIAGSVCGMLTLAVASSLWMVFAARALSGMSNANVSTAHAYVADRVPPTQRARYMGLMGSAIGLGFVFGPALGGLLSHPEIRGLPFFAGAGLAAMNWVMAFFLLPESRAGDRGRTAGPSRRLWVAIRETLWGTPVGWLVLTYFCFFGVFAGMESTFALFCEAVFSWTERQTGYLFSLIGVFILFTQGVLVGRFVAWLGEKRTMMVGMSVLAVGLTTVALAPSVLVLAIGGSCIAIGNGLSTPSMSSLVSQATTPEEQGWAQGLSQSAAALARIIAPIGAGLLFEHIAPGLPMLVGAALVVVAVLPIVGTRVRQPSE